MIKKISIINEDNIFNWVLDITKFKVKYPSVYNEYQNNLSEMDFFEIIEIIPHGDSVEEITIKIESVILFLSDGTKHKIFNTELINLFDTNYCEGWSIFSDEQFVYFIITISHFQKGALAIWDMKKKSWIFSYTEEDFCVAAIVYSKKNDFFIGLSIWNYPFVNNGGEYFFLIKRDRSFEQIQLEEISDIDHELIDTESCRPFLNIYNDCIDYEENKSIIIKKDKERCLFYYLNPQDI